MNRILGFVDDVGPSEVRGWAMDPDSDLPLEVSLYVNNKFVADMKCDEFRPEINHKGIHPTGRCGFRFKLHGEHLVVGDEVRLLARTSKMELRNSPWRVLEEPCFQDSTTFGMNLPAATLTSIFKESPRPLICTNNQMGLLWSAKAGCTFAVKWFFYQIGLLDAASYYHPWVHRFREEVFYNSQPYKLYFNSISKKPFLWFKVVRSPYARAVSSYVHAIRHGYENAQMESFLNRKITDRDGFSFREFTNYLGTIDITKCNIHHMQQLHPVEVAELIPNIKIIKLEDSFNSFQEIERQYNLIQSPLRNLRESVHNSVRNAEVTFQGDMRFSMGDKTFPSFHNFYDDEITRFIADVYIMDFSQYKYSRDITCH